jgi:hypothetical protein
MTESATMSTIAPNQLFVIACPACRGHVAASGGMCGRDACCPLCASLFHVPTLTLAGAVVPSSPTPTPPPPAEDWGNVIETLAPPMEKPVAEPAFEQPSDFEIPPEPEGEPAVASAPAPVVEPSLRDRADAATGPVGSADLVGQTPDASSQFPSADWIDEVLATPVPDGADEGSAAPEGVPHLGPQQLAPADQELEFREPVRTVRHGDTVIEIRRLTPEERRARRFRRNLMMIVIGVSILMAIVVIFGVPTKPPR